MAGTTTRWALRYPTSTDTADVPRDMQNLANDLDSVTMLYSGTLAARAAISHVLGKFYLATDTAQLFMSNGTSWVEIPFGAPGIPIGATVEWNIPVDPADTRFVIEDGRAISRTTYATLFALMGTTHGAGDGSTTFNIPDSRGRTAVGAGAGTGLTNRVLGTKGGAETHALLAGESGMPAHAHTASSGTESADHAHYTSGTTGGDYPDHAHSYAQLVGGSGVASGGGWGGTVNFTGGASARHQHDFGAWSGGRNAAHTHAITVNNAAALNAAAAHNNMQPWIAKNKIIRIA